MDIVGVESLFTSLRTRLVALLDLLAADELQTVDACERMDLWQDAQSILARLATVEWALGQDAQAAERPKAIDISERRRESVARTRRRSPPSSEAEVTELLASR